MLKPPESAPKTRSRVLGVDVHALTMDDVLARVQRAIDDRRRLRIGVVNAAKLVNMGRDAALFEDVSSSDLVLADGMSVVWASRINDTQLPERVAGIDLMHRIMADGAASERRVFLLGAKEEVNDEVARRALTDYPGLIIAGQQHGYFSEAEEDSILSKINAARADVLFVAITSPKKERLMAQWGDALNTPVVHGVGGSFDVYAGKVSRAPVWMQSAGLEWFHRVLQEPGRMWRRYLVTNALFVFRVLRDSFGRSRSTKQEG